MDVSSLSPVIAFPQLHDETTMGVAPVLTYQATFVRGGLFLDVAAQHNIMDGTGLFHSVRLLAEIMRNEQPSPTEVAHGNQDRRSLFRLLAPDEPSLDHSHLLRESLVAPAMNPTIVDCRHSRPAWSFFRVCKADMVTLKAQADRVVHIVISDDPRHAARPSVAKSLTSSPNSHAPWIHDVLSVSLANRVTTTGLRVRGSILLRISALSFLSKRDLLFIEGKQFKVPFAFGIKFAMNLFCICFYLTCDIISRVREVIITSMPSIEEPLEAI
jgi:hypothetical protein